MPYADPDKSRTYQREYKRLARAGSCQTPGQTQVPAEFRLQTASDVLQLLGGQAEAVRRLLKGEAWAKRLEKPSTGT